MPVQTGIGRYGKDRRKSEAPINMKKFVAAAGISIIFAVASTLTLLIGGSRSGRSEKPDRGFDSRILRRTLGTALCTGAVGGRGGSSETDASLGKSGSKTPTAGRNSRTTRPALPVSGA